MIFKEKVQDQFRKAGWFEGRDVQGEFENKIKNFASLPAHLREFLKSYGNLLTEDCKPYESEVVNTLNTDVAYIENSILKNRPFSDVIYKVGYWYPDHYFVYTDNIGTIYLVGDCYFKLNDSFEKGIENIIEDDWDSSLEWNPETRQWVKEY